MLRSLLAPDSPMSKSLKDIVSTLRDHFEPKPSIIAERFKFHKRNQNPGESIATYIAELRRLAARCSFPREYLDDTLRDRFVCGLRSESIQKQLLSEKNLTMASALEKVQNLEAVQRNTQVLKGQTPSLAVGQVSGCPFPNGKFPTSKSHRGRNSTVRGASSSCCGDKGHMRGDCGSLCYRCGDKGHMGRDCRFREAVCHKCGKIGHLAKVRRSGRGANRRSEEKSARVGKLASDSEGSDELLCNVYVVGSEKIKPYKVVLELDGQPVSLEIDTGAAVSVIPESLQRKNFPRAVLEKANVKLRTYTGKPITVLGQISVTVKHRGYEGRHTLYVVETCLDGQRLALLY